MIVRRRSPELNPDAAQTEPGPRCPTCDSNYTNKRLKVSDEPGKKWCKDTWHSAADAQPPERTGRLTAEQFWKEWVGTFNDPSMFYIGHTPTKGVATRFSEAFRDASEAQELAAVKKELHVMHLRAVSAEKIAGIADSREVAKLLRQLEPAEGGR